MRAAAYCRYSSSHQREESIEAQLREINKYCKQNDIKLLHKYCDQARTGTNDDRQEFQKMISDAKENKFDCVIIHKIDRFARNRYDHLYYKKLLEKHGIKIVSVTEHLDGTPESILLESLLTGLSEFYSSNLSREVMKGMKENAYQAKFNGGWAPLGYDIVEGRYLVNEHEASIVKLIFAMYLDGHGYGSILSKLNALGYKTKRGRPFGKNSIYEILRNAKYTGHYVFNKAPRRIDGKRNWHRKKESTELITVRDAVPAIISEEDFKMVQEKMKSREKGPRQQKDATVYILTGKAICGKCGGPLVGNSSRRAAGAEPVRYYECSRKLRTKECDLKRKPKAALEAEVFEVIQTNFLAPEKLPEIAKKMVALTTEKDQESMREEKNLKTELKDTLEKIGNIIKAVENGADFTIFGSRLKELKARKEDIQYRLDALKNPLEGITEEMVLSYLSTLPKASSGDLTDLDKKKIVDNHVHEVIVYEDRTNVNLKAVIGADKDGVGGLTLTYPHTLHA